MSEFATPVASLERSRSRFVHWTLERSFTVSTMLLVLILMGLTMFLVHVQLRNSLKAELDERGISMARSIGAVATPSLLAYNYAALQIAAEAAARDPIVEYVVIHDKEGAVAGVAGTDEAAPPRPETLAPRSGAVLAFDAKAGGGARVYETVREIVVPVRVEGAMEPWGTVRLGLSIEPMVAQLKRIDTVLAGIGLCLAILAAAVARWLARKITAPLRRLARGTEALRVGQLTHRVPVTGAKELADVSQAFNTMIAQVEEKERESAGFQRQLERLNATLEQQVRDRTRALEESEAQYRSLVEHSPDAILIVQDGKVRFVNSVFETTFGISRVQASSYAFELTSIFDASSAAEVAERIAGWERGESPAPIAVKAQDAAGKIRQIELRGSGIEHRGRLAAECLLIDTTEADELRGRLNETEKLRSLGELAGGIAHDFNNLLGAILGRTQLLRRRPQLAGIDAELAVIEKAAQDGRETVRRIQEFSRVRKERPFDVLDLGEILRDCIEMTRTQWKAEAESRGVSISIDLQVGNPQVPDFETSGALRILGNPSELRELFINLILNAIDAMPRGGDLSLACREQGERVQVLVADTGVGMTESTRQQLFDPFFTTKGPRGTGLGMSMAYGIVTRHEGTIEVRTAPGEGTTFMIDFPRAGAVSGTGEEKSANWEHGVHPSRILVIDDEPEIAAVLREVLMLQGHAVETALSALEGVKQATTKPFDLVFTDLGMPEMSGWEVAAAIRAKKPNLPVALVTGWAASIEEAEIQRRGIAALVHKPFEIVEVHRASSELLARVAHV